MTRKLDLYDPMIKGITLTWRHNQLGHLSDLEERTGGLGIYRIENGVEQRGVGLGWVD